MRNDSRLSRMLHVLLHMARHDGPITSERIGQMLQTNPVVVRRTMGGLRTAGYVRSEKGHGGGWTITRKLDEISLLDVYQAVGGPKLFAIGNESSNPQCAVERAVNQALDTALSEAEKLLMTRLGDITLAELAGSFNDSCAAEAHQQQPEPTPAR